LRPGGFAIYHDVFYFTTFWPMLTTVLQGWEALRVPAFAHNKDLGGEINFGIGIFRKPIS